MGKFQDELEQRVDDGDEGVDEIVDFKDPDEPNFSASSEDFIFGDDPTHACSEEFFIDGQLHEVVI